MAPIHRRVENPPKSCLQNLTHSGVVGGGVNALGPSRARISFARAVLNPYLGKKNPNTLNLNNQSTEKKKYGKSKYGAIR